MMKKTLKFIEGKDPFECLYFEESSNVKGDDLVAWDRKKTWFDVIQLKGNKIPPHLISLDFF